MQYMFTSKNILVFNIFICIIIYTVIYIYTCIYTVTDFTIYTFTTHKYLHYFKFFREF